jgi:predicted enzyme related to lactoylglutathione lyase
MVNLLVNIDVDDLARGVDFYTRAFGLRVGRRFGTAAVELLGGEVPLYLLAKAVGTPFAAQARGAVRDYGRHWTPLHLDFAVTDIHAAMRAALEAGAVQEGSLQTHAWGYIAMFADPFGHGFCLLQFVGRGYDEVAT